MVISSRGLPLLLLAVLSGCTGSEPAPAVAQDVSGMPVAISNNAVAIIEDADGFPLYSFMGLTESVSFRCNGNAAVSKRAACWFDFTTVRQENSRAPWVCAQLLSDNLSLAAFTHHIDARSDPQSVGGALLDGGFPAIVKFNHDQVGRVARGALSAARPHCPANGFAGIGRFVAVVIPSVALDRVANEAPQGAAEAPAGF